MRVIAGKFRSRTLKALPGLDTRPTYDRLKETLFNVLASTGGLEDAVFIDLFAGTGSIGIEALSRGASFVRFSDLNRLPIDTIQANLQITGFSAQAEVRRGDAYSMLETAPTRPFDYVYIAPPQYKEMAWKALQALDANPGWLNDEGAWVIVQIHPREYRKLELQALDEFEQRKYGSTLLVFYEKK